MTDNEIVKALECCNRPANQTSCDDCPYQFSEEKCSSKLFNDNIALITRQKAEIEELKSVINGFRGYDERIKAEAVTEFAERFLSCYEGFDEVNEAITYSNLVRAVKDVLKEMGVEDNADRC